MDVSVFRFDTAMFQPCGRTRITAVWRRHSASALSAGAASCRLPQLKMPPYSLAVDSIAPAACGRFRAVCPPSLEFSSSFQQVPHTAFHPSGAASGGVLDPIFAIAVLPALLGGIPELEAQVLCTTLQSPVDKLLGDGFVLGCFSLIFSISITSCRARPKPCRAPAPSGHAAAIVSDGRVVIS